MRRRQRGTKSTRHAIIPKFQSQTRAELRGEDTSAKVSFIRELILSSEGQTRPRVKLIRAPRKTRDWVGVGRDFPSLTTQPMD